MATKQGPLIRFIHRIAKDAAVDNMSDGRLLACFAVEHDEATFTELVRRHGPLVLSVCRRVLGNKHDAEDAFQATFLVLVRKANSIAKLESVGSWLYGVAYRIASKAKVAASRRRIHEKAVSEMPMAKIQEEPDRHDLGPVLDEEMQRLPEKYRAVLVLCYLQGKTINEAARALRCPRGTVGTRLARGREMLRSRLTRRGLTLTAGLFANALAQTSATAVPPNLALSAVKTAILSASGAATAAISPQILALTEGELKAMFLTNLKTITALLIAVGAAGAATTLLTYRHAVAGTVVAWEMAGPGDVVQKEALPQPQGDPRVTVLPAHSRPPRLLVEHQSPVTCLAWSADGRWLATGTQDGTVHVTEAATGKVRGFPTQGSAVTAIAFSPDGNALELFNQLLRQSTWDAGTGEQLGGHSQYDYAVDHLAFMPGGQWVVAVTVESFIKRQFVRSGPAEGRARGGTRGDGYAAVAPDGTVSGFCDATGRLIVLQSGSADKIDFGDDFGLNVGKARPIAFGPGGKLLAVGDEKGVQLWDLRARKKTHALAGLDQPTARLAISADGSTLAALAADGMSVLVWDLTRNTTRCRIGHNRGVVGSLALSPDGKMLATTVKDEKAIFLWKVEARELTHKGPPLDVSAKDLAALWGDLASLDASKAEAAWSKLGAAGDNAMPFLQQRIRSHAVPSLDRKRLEKLVADLDAEDFATREQATKQLMAAGEPAISLLKRLLEKPPSLEAERRAITILNKLAEPTATPERLRVLEAIYLLEQLRTAKAIALLEEIERDAQIAQVRREARRALQGIARRQKENK